MRRNCDEEDDAATIHGFGAIQNLRDAEPPYPLIPYRPLGLLAARNRAKEGVPSVPKKDSTTRSKSSKIAGSGRRQRATGTPRSATKKVTRSAHTAGRTNTSSKKKSRKD